MNLATRRSLRGVYGLGAGPSGAQLGVSIGQTVGTAAATAAISSAASSAAAAGTTFSLLGMGASAAIPVVGAAIAGVAIGIEALINSSLVQGCGQTCIETSQWANQAEPLLQKNIDAYFAISPPRPQSVQAQAVNNFMSVWNQLVQLCSQPGLGAAGKNCIADRQSGACKWKATSTGAYPGQPAQGACWNWWSGYHDPIANDTQTYNDSVVSGGTLAAPGTTSGGATVIPASGSSDLILIVGGALALILVVTLL